MLFTLLALACHDTPQPPAAATVPRVDPSATPTPPLAADGIPPVPSGANGCELSAYALEDRRGGPGTLTLSMSLQGAISRAPLLVEIVHPEDGQLVSLTGFSCVLAPTLDLTVASNLGEASVVVFLDTDNNGPSPSDPAGATPQPIQIGTEDIDGVVITVRSPPALGELALPYKRAALGGGDAPVSPPLVPDGDPQP